MNKAQNSAKEHNPATGVFARFFRWLFSWRVMRRWLFVLACLTTLTGLCYAVENWRGKQAWEKCRRELEAKGEVLDWNAYIPAPVPDDQNIFKAPKMAEWFVKGSMAEAFSGKPSKSPGTNAPFRLASGWNAKSPPMLVAIVEVAPTNAPFSLAPGWNAKRPPVLLAEVKVVPSDTPLPPGKADAVLRFDDPAAHEQAAKLLDDITGPHLDGAQGSVIFAGPLDQSKPATLVVLADTLPSVRALTSFLSHSPGTDRVGLAGGRDYLQIARLGSNGFQVSLMPSTAANYLALSQAAVPDFDLVRKALERPFARMDGNYERPFERPIPNFVRLRTVAQLLSQRAQCYLLLGQPEAAWHELALVRDVCRMLEAEPSSNAATVVQAMIDVAITGLHTQVIADGLRLQAWREPELAEIQKQLTDVNLLPLVRASFKTSPAAVCRTYEIAPPVKLFGMAHLPRGWIYQNMCTIALLDHLATELFDVPNNQILPRNADEIENQIKTTFRHFAPYTFLARIGVSDFVKALQTLARTQTRANEAFIACGLERYRLAHGQYPETLEALVPQFAEKLPHDIIGGQPLKYHRTADGQFVLYSVGWNEKDDGGVPGKTVAEGDWVWP